MGMENRYPWDDAYLIDDGGRSSFSSFWLGDHFLEQLDRSDPEYLMRLSALRRATADFIRLQTGYDVPVMFSSGTDTYAIHTDSQEAVIISANDDPAKLDAQVGRALHEGGHLVLSKKTGEPESVPYFAFIKTLHHQPSKLFAPGHYKHIARLKMSLAQAVTLVQDIMNFLEDRRIDSWQYERAPGYRGYYRAFYRDSWLSDSVDTMFTHPAAQMPVLECYRFHLINMMNRHAHPDMLPGLREIWDLVDLKNIRRFAHDRNWKNVGNEVVQKLPGHALLMMPEMVQVAFDIALVMMTNSITVDTPPEMPRPEDVSTETSSSPNLDIPTDAALKDIEYINAQSSRELNGEYSLSAITEEDEITLDALERSGAEFSKLGGEFEGVKVIVFKKVDEGLLNTGAFPFTVKIGGDAVHHTASQHAVTDGIALGNRLAHRLQVMGDESVLVTPRQKTGKLDKRRIALLGFGADDVFAGHLYERFEPVVVHLSIDSSGSMATGGKWYQALKLAVALARCAEKIRNLEVVITLRTGTGSAANVAIVHDSRQDPFVRVKTLFPYLIATGSTPEGLAFDAIKNVVLEHATGRRYFVNLSDGDPQFAYHDKDGLERSYAGEKAWAHTAGLIREFRTDGICVLSYFVRNPDDGAKQSRTLTEAFRTMYGKDSHFINPESVTDIALTLNRLFLDREE